MAGEQQLQRRTLETQSSAYDEEEEELELQLEVKKMAEAILHYRTTLPDRLNKTFGSLISTQRPFLPSPPPLPQMTTDSGTSDGDQNPDVGDADQLTLLSEVALPEEEEDPETAEKIRLLKLKISSNISATPIILDRMKEAISRIDKLELQKGENYCRWAGVVCNNRTDHVIRLHLQELGLGGELNSSLQKLKLLRHLDLSFNDLQGISIPDFLGSLQSLRYLNLSI